MYEQLGLDTFSPLSASALLGIALGIVFGVLAFSTKFCLRRALVGDQGSDSRNAATVWLSALAAAVAGTQIAVLMGWIEFSTHRFHSVDLPYALIALGGLLFGAGMILTRGCASRMSVLAGGGNLRAVYVLVLFSIAAHATLKGVFSPLRTELAKYTVNIDALTSLAQSPAFSVASITAGIVGISFLLSRMKSNRSNIVGGALIGLLVPMAWVGTGLVLLDDFDPIVFQSLSFASSGSEFLFWSIASTSIGAGFGVGLLSGVLLGSAAMAIIKREFRWESFANPGQTGRYSAGAILMGVGGVLAGGCTVGAGLSGISSLSLGAMLTLIFIILGAKITDAYGRSRISGQAVRPGTRPITS